jgi:hypothetical protein
MKDLPPTRTGIVGKALVIERLDTGQKLAVPWPLPPPKWGVRGWWEPRVLGAEADGTLTGVWHWVDDPTPGRRADEGLAPSEETT